MSMSKNLRVIAALGTLSGAVWAGTFASFTDDASSSATFTAGTVDLVAGGDVNDAYDFASLTVPNMKPGDVQYAPLTIDNAGTLGFTYGMTSAAVDGAVSGLGAALDLEIRSVAAAGDCTAAGWSAATSVVPAGGLTAAAITGRTLAAASGEVLCFQVTFPDTGAGLDNALQGSSTTATFSFTAAQA